MRSLIKYIDEALFNSASEFSKADNNELEFVNLDLPSGILWGKCNLGADEETDYGHYYMWGSTEPNDNDDCCWKNAPFNNGKNSFDEDYFNSVKNKVCPNGILAPEYDVAYQESNGDYRMPTKKEINELINNTNNEWVYNFNNSEINGYKFTSKKDKDTYIFIPAAGGTWNKENKITNVALATWLADSYEDKGGTLYFRNFGKHYNEDIQVGNSFKYRGFPVRAVQDK